MMRAALRRDQSMPPASPDRPPPGSAAIPQTAYPSSAPSWPNRYVWPVLVGILRDNPAAGRHVFEIGSGNGATANMLTEMGYDVIGIDPSVEGVEIARRSFPKPTFHL